MIKEENPLWLEMEAAFDKIERNSHGLYCFNQGCAAMLTVIARRVEERGERGLELDAVEVSEWLLDQAEVADSFYDGVE